MGPPQPPPALTPLQALLPSLGVAPLGLAPIAAVGADPPGPAQSQHPMTSPADLMELHVLLPALLVHPDPNMVPTFLDALCAGAPAMLADLVMAIMLTNNIPPPHQIAMLMEQQRAHEQQRADALRQAEAAAEQVAAGAEEPGAQGGPSALPSLKSAPSAGAAGSKAVVPGQGGVDSKGAAPSGARAAGTMQQALGAGGDSSRFLPPGKRALPLELPPSAGAQDAAAPGGPLAPATLFLMQALRAGSPLVLPNPLPALAARALHASSFRRICAAATQLPTQALDLRELLLARLAVQSFTASAKQQGAGALHAAADVRQSMLAAAVAEIAAQGGQGLALRWLTALLAEHVVRSLAAHRPAAQGAVRGAAEPHAEQASMAQPDSKKADVKQGSAALQAAAAAATATAAAIIVKSEADAPSAGGSSVNSIPPLPVGSVELAGTPYEEALLGLITGLRWDHWSGTMG